WRQIWPQPAATDRRVGVMGLGSLGAPIAQALSEFGFVVLGWARTAKPDFPLPCFHGLAGLDEFLPQAGILLNLLPSTPEPVGLLDARRLRQLPRGAALINAGRGATIDENALLAALNDDHLGSATLDVFVEEPLPPDSALWAHPRITLTPHCASAVT